MSQTAPMSGRSPSPIQNNSLFIRRHKSGRRVRWTSRLDKLGEQVGWTSWVDKLGGQVEWMSHVDESAGHK